MTKKLNYKFYPIELTEEEKDFWRPKWKSEFKIGQKTIKVPGEIYNYLEIEGKICLTITSIPLINRNRNIWSYNEKGEKEWEIEARCKSMGENEFVDPYTGFYKEEEKIIVTTFDGFYGELDVETGKVKDWKWSR